MTREDRYTRYVTEHATPPPATSGKVLHWDGGGAVSQEWQRPEESGGVRAAPDWPCSSSQEVAPELACASPALDWSGQAASMTFYLAPLLFKSTAHDDGPRVTGVVIWVRQQDPPALPPPYPVHPALLVHAVPTGPPATYVELQPHFPREDPLHQHIVLVLQATLEAHNTAEQLYVEVLCNALAVHLLRRYRACQPTVHEAASSLSPARLQRTIIYVQEHLEEELSLTTLAALVHLSPDHFARLFKQAMGQTPHQYILTCRIARAKQLLTETAMSLSAIGLHVGCVDQSYFTALFRRHVAMTPKAFREATVRT